ncbi:MAG TPA: GMC family oxidoreductase [Vicinamibacterales bacterium]|nr:GMC family oxidoreductase [Vicinamibacterales bacterium]
MQIIRNRTLYDVCVIGSGAGGGMAAMVLTEAGANVVMLEAGPLWDSTTESAMFKWPYDTPRRGAAIPERQFGEFDGALGGWTLEGEPYTSAPGNQFDWFRSRMLGGRTNHWGRISLRFGPDDFRRKSLDSLGDDWPITYEDLKPYYDKIDRFIGVFGVNLPNFPNEPDGIFLPPPQPRCYELMIKQASERLNIPCVPSRLSILTKPLNGRPACHYCSQCGRGCATHSNFSSPSVLIPPAMKTGRLKIIPGAMAREVTIDDAGLASGVTYVDKATARDNHVRARIVVVAGGACESARLLLNSKSTRFPQGLANSSGTVGKFLMDSTGASVTGFIPKLMDGIPHNEDGVGGMHLYMPWWLDNKKLDFPRGYHIEIGGGRRMPNAGFGGGIHNFTSVEVAGRPYSFGGYGKDLKNDYRRLYGATVNFAGRGEMIPNADSYCDIDPTVVDKWGIPVLRFHYKWSDYELNQVKHMQETFRAIIQEMGGRPTSPMPTKEDGYGIAPGGRIIHEVGVTRMGSNPSTSVLNRNCQAHDVKNLFVADGGPLPSQADKNCTWTILALSMRTAEFIADARRAGTV